MANKNSIKPPLYPENIPAPLKQWPNWVVWKEEIRNGEPTKPPIDVRTSKKAKSDDENTWTNFDNALDHYNEHKNNGIRGIGLQFGEPGSTSLVGWDLDHCRDPETGEIQPWAQEIIDILNSYTEISPSGTGIRIFTIGVLPREGRKKKGIECYDGNRYLTITGNHLEGTPLTIEPRYEEIKSLHKRIFGEQKVQEQPQTENVNHGLHIEDDELLKLAFSAKNGDKLKKLWEGDCSGHPSRSEAHMALCCHLAFWTGNNAESIDRLFRQSKLFPEYAEKWDRKHFANGRTYGEETIRRAIEKTTEVYDGGKEKRSLEKESSEGKKQQRTELIMSLFEEFPSSFFSNNEIRDATGLAAPDVRDVLRKKREQGVLIFDGNTKKHRLTPPSRIVDPFAVMAGAFDLEFPLGVHEYAVVSQGDVVIISGEKNSGKTGYLMDTAIINSKKGMQVNFLFTENVQKIGKRYIQWGYTVEEIKERIVFRDIRDRDYTSIIQRDCLNVLDYYNPQEGEYFRTAADIERMAKALGGGVLVIGIQQPHGKDVPRGGELANELSQLTISLSDTKTIHAGVVEDRKVGKAKITIIKEPGMRKGGEGRVCEYEVTSEGGRLERVGVWEYPKKKEK